MRTLIRNGAIVDGTGQPRCNSDLVVEGEVIAAIGAVQSGGANRHLSERGL